MSAPFCGQSAVIMPMVSLLPLRARLHGDGPGGAVTSAHSPFAQGSPLSRMSGLLPPHPRRQQPPAAAARDDGGSNGTGSSGGGDSGNGSRSRGSGNSRQGGRRQPLRMNNSDSQEGHPGQAPRNGAADSQSARPGGWVNGSREQLQRRQQHQQQGNHAQRGSGQTFGDRGRGASRGGKRGGPSMRLPDRPPRGSSADSSDSSEQLDEVLERYMGDNAGGGRARDRAPSQTAPRPSGEQCISSAEVYESATALVRQHACMHAGRELLRLHPWQVSAWASLALVRQDGGSRSRTAMPSRQHRSNFV